MNPSRGPPMPSIGRLAAPACQTNSRRLTMLNCVAEFAGFDLVVGAFVGWVVDWNHPEIGVSTTSYVPGFNWVNQNSPCELLMASPTSVQVCVVTVAPLAVVCTSVLTNLYRSKAMPDNAGSPASHVPLAFRSWNFTPWIEP